MNEIVNTQDIDMRELSVEELELVSGAADGTYGAQFGRVTAISTSAVSSESGSLSGDRKKPF